MKRCYDFTNAERGKFHKKNLVLEPPVYLDESNAEYIENVARQRNVDISTVVNEILHSGRSLAKTAK